MATYDWLSSQHAEELDDYFTRLRAQFVIALVSTAQRLELDGCCATVGGFNDWYKRHIQDAFNNPEVRDQVERYMGDPERCMPSERLALESMGFVAKVQPKPIVDVWETGDGL